MSILPRAEILLGGFAYSLAKWITFTGQAATVTNDAYFAYAMRYGRDNPVTNTATVKPGDETMTQSKPLTIRPAMPTDVDEVTRIYIDSCECRIWRITVAGRQNGDAGPCRTLES